MLFSPDATRSMMDLMQQGWERGRSLFDPPEKSTETMTGTRAAAEPGAGEPSAAETSPAEAGEAGHQGDE